jgi:hypothetical protein
MDPGASQSAAQEAPY